MARAPHPPREETLEERIDRLIAHSQGTMPVGILCADKAEAEAALAILARKPGGRIITVYVNQDGYTVQYQPDKK